MSWMRWSGFCGQAFAMKHKTRDPIPTPFGHGSLRKRKKKPDENHKKALTL